MKTLASFLSAFACIGMLLLAAELPRPAMDLTIVLPDGKNVKLSDERGKVVILTFILTT